MKLTLTFTHERSTKNTERFAEDATGTERPAVGTLYILRSALGVVVPTKLTVTIEEAES